MRAWEPVTPSASSKWTVKSKSEEPAVAGSEHKVSSMVTESSLAQGRVTVGDLDGEVDGIEVTGLPVGLEIVGSLVGMLVGSSVVGTELGVLEGAEVGGAQANKQNKCTCRI